MPAAGSADSTVRGKDAGRVLFNNRLRFVVRQEWWGRACALGCCRVGCCRYKGSSGSHIRGLGRRRHVPASTACDEALQQQQSVSPVDGVISAPVADVAPQCWFPTVISLLCCLPFAVLCDVGAHPIFGRQAHHLWPCLLGHASGQAVRQCADGCHRPADDGREDLASAASGLVCGVPHCPPGAVCCD